LHLSVPPDLSALILTANEEANIDRTLAALHWVPSILVIDSGSTDATLAILGSYPSVRVLHRPFDSFAGQTNFGLSHLDSAWVLSLDADYLITPSLAQEITTSIASAADDLAGFSIPFRYCVAGRPLRATLLPPRTALYRRHGRRHPARYIDDGHSHRVQIDGRLGHLHQPILHDDRKPLSRWLESQRRYLPIEAAKLLATPSRQLSSADRLRRDTPLAPLAVLVLCLVFKAGLLDGWRGCFYAGQRVYAELLLLLLLVEARRFPSPISSGPTLNRRSTL
jgi:glycosyltransferase involved in cell wall biosynthesis